MLQTYFFRGLYFPFEKHPREALNQVIELELFVIDR